MEGLDQCREGLEWDDGGFDLKPRWAREPQLDAVPQLCRRPRRVLGLAHDDHCHVAFHAEGAFNKLYLVDGPRGKCLLRNRLTDIAAEPVVFDPKPGQLVSRFFFRGNHFRYDIPRGPFPSSHDWLSTYLGIIRQEQTDILQNDDDEDVREDAESCLQVATKLAALLPKIFPPLQHPAERTVLWHDDLSLSNILVDADNADDAKVTTILDWECVSCQPLWAATEMPKFLLGPTREAEPVRDGYADDDGEDDVHVGADGLDNEGRTELYWIHRMEYDMTRLRKVYNEQVWEQLVPWWETEVLYGALKLDFLAAVEQCAAGWHLKGVVRWVEAVEGGKHPRLMDVLDPNWNGCSAVSRPSPHSQAGVRTSGTPRVNKKSRLLYYPVRINDSPHPAHDGARGSLHRRRPLRSQGSRSAPVAPPRAKSLLYLAASGEDNAPRRPLAALTVVQIGLLESVFEIGKPFV
ncbi:hypothetical protein CHGG_05335 [Chaetomium globosum CBS 148.51]|uniref:Aminoglycoside phosphotransferase domain-containing protein n=1 Tax=Chaetomium globosum (strain ATCC 6205 / CBS 148.51 / DSM 1962 / NBRC 6347 / NRRL 1970) TaxID=306901 RepID=Q2H7N0_CHAGB|nr:uncharacterized protein CHGG_05335 [Chaetomium globosum CBS 148.51]EAQ88716.1 hypothetical protein CHGG_05335 [Chaetomium globosum CBS 148.51]